MEHCLLLPCYQKDSRVVVLKADHHVVNNNGDFTFKFYANPDLSTSKPYLSFEANEFCILCGALEKEADSPQSCEQIQECSSSAASDTTSTQTSSAKSSQACLASEPITVDTAIDLHSGNRGHKQQRPSESQSVETRKPMLEYTILVYEPLLPERIRPFQVWAFVCHNCFVAIKVRMQYTVS